MRNYYEYGQNPYSDVPCCYLCPVMQNYYRYQQPDFNNFYKVEEEDSKADNSIELNADERKLDFTREHAEQVAAAVKKDSKHIFKDIEKFITDSRLLDFLLIALITYIANNYFKYKDVIEEKTDEFIADMRRNLPWIFDILGVFGITPEAVDRFLDNLIRVTVLNLQNLAH